MSLESQSDRWIARFTRRFFIDVLVVLSTVALVAILIDTREHDAEEAHSMSATRAAVRMLQAEIDLQNALTEEALVGQRFPPAINPAWFEGQLPTNSLVTGDRPWIDVAGPDELELRHPRDPTCEGRQAAMFWYNPHLGIVRARVPRSISDSEAIRLYNEVNRTGLNDLKATASVEDRD